MGAPDGPAPAWPRESGLGSPIRSSASSCAFFLPRSFQNTYATPPAMMAKPPTPTQTPITMLRCCDDRPDESLSLPFVERASVAVPVVVAMLVTGDTWPFTPVVVKTVV